MLVRLGLKCVRCEHEQLLSIAVAFVFHAAVDYVDAACVQLPFLFCAMFANSYEVFTSVMLMLSHLLAPKAASVSCSHPHSIV